MVSSSSKDVVIYTDGQETGRQTVINSRRVGWLANGQILLATYGQVHQLDPVSGEHTPVVDASYTATDLGLNATQTAAVLVVSGPSGGLWRVDREQPHQQLLGAADVVAGDLADPAFVAASVHELRFYSDIGSQRWFHTMNGGKILDVALSPDVQWVATASADRAARILLRRRRAATGGAAGTHGACQHGPVCPWQSVGGYRLVG